jgi:SAM-dependent methyltransferase
MTHMQAGHETLDIDRFIRETEFAGYQRITLPDGRVIPGTDRSPTADLVFPADLTGKTVLDVGCNYGFFLQEAIRRGAKRAVGIEANPDSFRVASTLATLWKGRIEVHQGLLEEVQLNEKFDLVIFLNVIHHVTDPVPVVKKLASLCRGTLILEFRQPHDSQFVHECFHREKVPTAGRRSLIRRIAQRIRIATETRLMELATRRLPIIGIGSVEYHRSYFFSQAGFKNMFQIHNRLFKRVEFRPSLTRGQALAICDCSEGGPS